MDPTYPNQLIHYRSKIKLYATLVRKSTQRIAIVVIIIITLYIHYACSIYTNSLTRFRRNAIFQCKRGQGG